MSVGTGFRNIVVVCLLVLGMGNSVLRAEEPVVLSDVRLGQHKTYTRLVIETDTRVAYTIRENRQHEIAVRLSKPLNKSAQSKLRPLGIVKAVTLETVENQTQLAINTIKPTRVLRHFLIPAGKGKKPRIVIDLTTKTAKHLKKSPLASLPPMYTTIGIEQAQAPAPIRATAVPPPKQKTKQQARSLPVQNRKVSSNSSRKRPIEIASVGGIQMMFEGDDSDIEMTEVAVASATSENVEAVPAQVAQGAISMRDWLSQQQNNPNVTRAAQPAYQQAVPPAPPATRYSRGYGQGYGRPPTYRPPNAQAPSYQPSSPRPPIENYTSPDGSRLRQPAISRPVPVYRQPERGPGFTGTVPVEKIEQKEYAKEDEEVGFGSFYIGGGAGYSLIEFEPTSTTPSATSNEPLAWKAFAGYRPKENAGIEIGYTNVGSITETFSSGEADSTLNVALINGVSFLPLGKKFTGFFKAGANFWWENADATGNVTNETDTGIGAQLGAGIDFQIMPNLAVRGEWEFYLLTQDLYTNTFSANVMVTF